MNKSFTKTDVEAGINTIEGLIRQASAGRKYGGNEEVFPWQARAEFDAEYDNGIREQLIREFGGSPFTRQSWDEYGGYYYLDEEEKSRFGNSYQRYVAHCDDQCHDMFTDIINSLEEYKNYLYSIAEAAE